MILKGALEVGLLKKMFGEKEIALKPFASQQAGGLQQNHIVGFKMAQLLFAIAQKHRRAILGLQEALLNDLADGPDFDAHFIVGFFTAKNLRHLGHGAFSGGGPGAGKIFGIYRSADFGHMGRAQPEVFDDMAGLLLVDGDGEPIGGAPWVEHLEHRKEFAQVRIFKEMVSWPGI